MTLNTKTFNHIFYFEFAGKKVALIFLWEIKTEVTLEAQLSPSGEKLEEDQI